MNLKGMLHIILMNQSSPKMSKEDSYHPKKTIWLHSHNNSHHLRKAAKKTPSSTDQELKEKGVLKAVLWDQQIKCHKDQPLQHPQHKLKDHHRLPQSTIKIETTRIHRNTWGWQRPRSYQSKEEGIRTSPWNFVKYRSCYPAFWLIEEHYYMFRMWQKWPLEQKLSVL